MIQLLHDMEDTITYSILATMDCPFMCEHCMYSCVPGNTGYVSNEILSAMREQVATLERCGYHVTVNIIGGEPTMIPKEFGRVMHHVTDWATDISIVTNGWWLNDPDLARSIIKIICKWGCNHIDEDMLSVRISNDKYHTQCWNEVCGYETPSDVLRDLTDGVSDISHTTYAECAECGKDYDDENGKCKDCGCEEAEYYYTDEITFDTYDYKWIYCENNKFADDPQFILPQGRGADFGTNDPTQGGVYHSDCGHDLSFDPQGNLMDICCRGSWCPFGTVYDNPAQLMVIAQNFIQEVHPNCYECRDAAKAWAACNLEKQRATVSSDIQDYIIGD